LRRQAPGPHGQHKREAQAGHSDQAAGEQWLTQLQVGLFFAAIQMFIAVARKPG
ncbi:MAG: hypothetical protein QOG96_6999, partial [Pseudonocardiales bacterium]|nr:hypothetical protein [Pseudonocardiales bacterium]